MNRVHSAEVEPPRSMGDKRKQRGVRSVLLIRNTCPRGHSAFFVLMLHRPPGARWAYTCMSCLQDNLKAADYRMAPEDALVRMNLDVVKLRKRQKLYVAGSGWRPRWREYHIRQMLSTVKRKGVWPTYG